MATAHRESGFTFRIGSNDHDPAPVHAWKGGDVAVINLSSPVSVRVVKGMKPADVARAVEIVEANQKKMIKVWRETHE
jgi:hypothetical protein